MVSSLRKPFRYSLTFFAWWASFVSAAELPRPVVISALPGPYTVDDWKRDWPGCEFQDGVAEGHVSVRKEGEIPWLRVSFTPGQIGPEKGGAGWRFPINQHESMEFRYQMRFSDPFEFVKGGKLPGLSGGPENVSGGHPATGENGFSARLMWRRDGRGEAYVYHVDQPEEYGESFPFPEDFRFPVGRTFQVRLALSMNDPAKRDGTLAVWITLPGQSPRQVVDRRDLRWRTTDGFGVDSLYLQAFHGGGDKTWAPKRECWAEFSGLAWSGKKG
jgi:hypothetical protein